MKPHRIAIVILLMVYIGLSSGDTTTAASKDITKCLLCDAGKSPCEAKEGECKAKEVATTPAAAAPPDAAPAGGRLVEREDGDPPAEDGAAGAATTAPIKWKCLTIIGKEEKDKEDQMWKGCAASCTDIANAHQFPVKDPEPKCTECDTGDNCNSSVQIHAIKWIFFITAMICAGL